MNLHKNQPTKPARSMAVQRAGWLIGGLVAIFGAAIRLLWTAVFVLSAEYATPTGHELMLVTLTAGALASGIRALWQSIRGTNPATALRPLLLAARAMLIWFGLAPL